MLRAILAAEVAMTRIDLVKDLKPLYAPPKGKFVTVDVPESNFLMVDGEGDPNTSQGYRDAVETLYSVAYTAKFQAKLGPGKTDFRVMPLEGLWWSDDLRVFVEGDRAKWKWTMMIALPKIIGPKEFAEAKAKAAEKKTLPALKLIRLKPFREGRAVQTLYFGPYAEEGRTIAALHAYAKEAGYRLNGKHHEIYLSDPRRTAPAKLKTIIRQPVD
jgi:hypothetical protein